MRGFGEGFNGRTPKTVGYTLGHRWRAVWGSGVKGPETIRGGGEGAGGGHYVERATEGDRSILDEFLCRAIGELEAVHDENLKALEGFLEPRIAEVRAARIAAEAEGRFPAARCLK